MAVSYTATPSRQDMRRLFEASSMRKIACGEPSPLLLELARHLGPEFAGRKLREVLDLAHDSLAQNQRSEYFYKNTLIKKLIFGVHSPKTTSVFSEFRIGGSRADLVFVNRRASVYEIKTELDDMSKARKQALDYLGSFTDVSFVLAHTHVDLALKLLPTEVGITFINRRGRLSVVRPAISTDEFLSKQSIFDCFHLKEAQALLRGLGGGEDLDYSEALALLSSVDAAEVQRYLVRCLRKRAGREAQRLGWSSIPSALLAAAYSYELSASQWKSILEVLDTPITEIL